MRQSVPAPSAAIDGGTPGGHGLWVWAVLALVVALNLAALWATMGRRDRRPGSPARPPDERRLRSTSILLWSAIVAVSVLIGLGIAFAGPG